ncbi:MAG: hypothetical protein JO273_16005 [Methylobacteriaceae bacterium]|nr:hypothetical protein [Methylobacteriaceae bacterium]
MNSFISSFKPLAVAALAILGIELGVQIIVRPNFVERSNYLDFNYLTNELAQKLIIYEKLKDFADTQADFVQVGDSSGFHAIIPNLVEPYLGGMTYANLGCCGNTGFSGYYHIAKSVVANDHKLKAIVLYVSLNNLPREELVLGDKSIGGGDRIYSSFAAPWAVLSPPSLALRPVVTSNTFSLGGLVRPMTPGLTVNGTASAAMKSIDRNRGWWPEDDLRLTDGNPNSKMSVLCGKDDLVGLWLGAPSQYRGLFGESGFDPTEVFGQFADLARRYGAKLIIAFQPHPCSRLMESTRAQLRSIFSILQERYRNLVVVPPEILEHWPVEMFASADHLRVGYEADASRRLGRLLAGALGLPGRTDDVTTLGPEERIPDADASTEPVWTAERFLKGWTTFGVTIRTDAPDGIEEITADPSTASHSFETAIQPVVPARPYVLSVAAKPSGVTKIRTIIRDRKVPGRIGTLDCDLAAGSAARTLDAFDGGIEALADGWRRCWVSVELCDKAAAVGIQILDAGVAGSAAADGGMHLLVRDVRLQPGWRLASKETPVAPVTPFGQKCE